MDLDAVYALASKHMLSAAAAMALESAGLKDERSSKAIGSAMRRAVIFDRALADVKAQLDRAGI